MSIIRLSKVIVLAGVMLVSLCQTAYYACAQDAEEQDGIELDDGEAADGEISNVEAAADEIDLGSAEVLGTRSLSAVIGESHALTTLSAKEFAGAASMAEALERVPGMDVRFQGGQGQLSTAQVRGARANQALVLVDGQPLSAGATVDLSLIPLQSIERVEVLRGPEAARFGAGALGGVVNFITRRQEQAPAADEASTLFPLDEHKLELNAQASTHTSLAELELSAGSFDSGGAAFTWGDTNISAGAAHAQSRNAYSFQRTGGGTAVRRNNDAMHDSIWAAWSTHGLDQRLNVNLLERGVPGSAEFPTLSARFEQQQLSWQGSRDDWRLGLSAAHSRFSDPTPYLHTGAIDSRSTRLRLEFANGLLATQQGVWGIKPYVDYIDTNDYGAQERFGLEALRHWEDGRKGGRWALDLGATVASDQGAAPLLRASWSKRVKRNTTAYSAVGYAVRFPDFDELYTSSSGPVQGNPGLDPERALSYEAGVKTDLQRARLDASVFYTDYRDTIIFTPVSGYVVRASNTGKARVAGVEALLDWQLADALWWRTSSTWLPLAEYSSGIPLSGRAEHHANSRLEWMAHGVRAAASWDYTGRMPADLFGNLVIKPRAICGIELGWEWGRGALDLCVGNLFEKQARDAWNYPLPGREFKVKWSIKL
jgi:vitamin B12 transporter